MYVSKHCFSEKLTEAGIWIVIALITATNMQGAEKFLGVGKS